MNPQERIAQKMREHRQDAGLTQKQVAERLEIDERSYRRWEAATSYGYLYRLGDVARALEVPESTLLEGADIDEVLPPREAMNAKLDLVMEELRLMREALDRRDGDGS